ncbi:DUF1828 domain-containing protein [Acidithiobacillus thiooxidans]|uniref:DUF1828 domain-containing protein n=1 Tax=Acidithiobacillus thiooxidans TaxID=930 RepID=UPI0029C2E909|nr:DUF1828 domain-containing protein [Acidithiobacillus thiooxidans]MDX5935633.1 DUF1828 domain-containing protein [Acidithiobacillus thiooxidans]
MDVKIFAHNGRMLIKSAFSFADGDPLLLYVEKCPGGIVRLTDAGQTRMHLRDEPDSFCAGERAKLFRQMMAKAGVEENDGQIFLDTPKDQIRAAVLQLSEAIRLLVESLEP